jgi:hypothetical protein
MNAPQPWRAHSSRSLSLLASLLLTAGTALAQLDTNTNGLSDLWERHVNNGQLFNPENPDHHPAADPDGDAWTNLQESIAGTDPFSGSPPAGIVATLVSHLKDQQEEPSPEYPAGRIIDLAVISWDTLPGKQYTLICSPVLAAGTWLPVDIPYYGDGLPAAVAITLTDSEGQEPDKLFWRVSIADTDTDSDSLTDYEEILIGLNPHLAETFPGIPDLWVATHFHGTAATFDPQADPDGDGLSNFDEFTRGTNPWLLDTDGDGIPDGDDPDPLLPESSPVSAQHVRPLTPLE